MNYQDLKSEDILQHNDEYSAHTQAWKPIPDFMIGDKVPDCQNTRWRRPIVSHPLHKIATPKSVWQSILSMFKKP